MTAVSEWCQSRKSKDRSAEWALLGKYSLITMYFRIKENSHASKERDHVTDGGESQKMHVSFSFMFSFYLPQFFVVWVGLVWLSLGWGFGRVFWIFLFVFKFSFL